MGETIPIKMINKKIQGKKNRQNGAIWERKVREYLETNGILVFKNNNNVIDGKYKQGKAKFNPFTKALMMNGQGFPDFLVMIKHPQISDAWIIQLVECKVNGILDKEEKEKIKWIVKNLGISCAVISKEKIKNKINFKIKQFKC